MNKEWFFSGIGVFGISIIITLITFWYKKRKQSRRKQSRRKQSSEIHQSQRSGDNSNNYQSARDMYINHNEKSKNEEES